MLPFSVGAALLGGDLGGRIVGALVRSVSLPLRRPLRSAHAELLTREVLLLILRRDDGVEGIGEASVVDWLSDRSSAETERELERLAAEILADGPAASLLLQRSFDPTLSSTTRAGLQCALLDLEARGRAISLAHLLGAQGDGSLPVSALLSSDETLARREAARYTQGAFRTLKLKVGGDSIGSDLARVLEVRTAARPETILRLDANCAWRPPDAELALKALEVADVDFIEEPLRDTSPQRLSILRSLRAHVPVALDESIVRREDLDAAIKEEAADVLVLKLERVGGPLPALLLAETARRGGLRVVFTDSIESEVGRAATAHVAHAAGSSEALGLGGEFFLAEYCTHEGIRGAAEPRAHFAVRGPGLGIDLPRETDQR